MRDAALSNRASTPARRAPFRSRHATVGLVVAAAGLVVAAALWRLSDRTTVETEETFGHGHGVFQVVDRRRDPLLAASAGVVMAGALIAWPVLAARRRRPGRAMWAVPLLVGAVGLATYIGVERAQRETFPGAGSHADARAVAAAMAEGGIPCARVTDARARDPWEEVVRCRVSAELAIDDGFDDTFIRMWSDDDARIRWTESIDDDEVDAVLGPTWMIECEFESTCWEIRAAIGGKTY